MREPAYGTGSFFKTMSYKETARVKHILVTGGYGFVGVWFIPYFCKKYPFYRIVHISPPEYAKNVQRKCADQKIDNYIFIPGTACEEGFIQKIFKEYDIRGVINLTSEAVPQTDGKVSVQHIETIFKSTLTLLEAARQHWMDGPDQFKKGYRICRFHQASTTKVFNSADDLHTTCYAPTLPETAGKASGDLMALAYFKTFGMNITISHCSNNYGPGQSKQEFIPMLIQRCFYAQMIPIYGNGKNKRSWLHVLDHCKAIDTIFHAGEAGEEYIINGSEEITNIRMTEIICDLLDVSYPLERKQLRKDLIVFMPDKPGHDFKYVTDSNNRLRKELHWKPEEELIQGLQQTLFWYIDHPEK